MSCEHKDFHAHVIVNRLEDTGRFAADVTIKCAECKMPFVFLGLPGGLLADGAAVSFDGTEARLAIAPQKETETGKVIRYNDGSFRETISDTRRISFRVKQG